jgi:predicted transglutaminase-like cysteine proteinase
MLRVVIVLMVILSAGPALARKERAIKVTSLPAHATVAYIGQESRSPIGWVGLCRETPSECQIDVSQPAVIEMNIDVWRTLVRINTGVNAEIKPMSDQEQWGVVERWNLPTTGAGDCEDYALLKRKRLADAGLSRRAMLMTVVIDETGGGHAILTVRTTHGDYVLDNKRNAIMAWESTGYNFVKRESQDVVGWVGMGEQTASTTAGN